MDAFCQVFVSTKWVCEFIKLVVMEQLQSHYSGEMLINLHFKKKGNEK